MKQSTYDKISRAAAWTRRYEPIWYLGWAMGCVVAGIIVGSVSAVIIGVMGPFLADMAAQRNQAERSRDDWYRRTLEWESLSNTWMALYMAEKAKNGR